MVLQNRWGIRLKGIAVLIIALLFSALNTFAQINVGFTQSQFVRTEGQGGGTSNVSISVSSTYNWSLRGRTLEIKYTTGLPATADPGTDYTASSGTITITWVLGISSTATINIPIVGDAIPEPNEYFTVTLSDAQWRNNYNGPTVNLTNNPATVLIVDDDYPPYQLTIADNSMIEGTGTPLPLMKNGELTIGLDRAVAEYHQVTVKWLPNNGASSATWGVDHLGTLIPLTVTFSPGDQYKTISLPVYCDAHVEGDETVAVDISDPSVNAIITDSRGTLTILDDDDADFRITKTLYTMDDVPVTTYIVAGQQYKYKGSVTNLGPGNVWSLDPDDAIKVVDELPRALIFNSCSSDGTYNPGTHSITWSFGIATAWGPGTIRTGEAVVTVATDLIQGEPIINTVKVVLPEYQYAPDHVMQPDPVMENNIATYELALFLPNVDSCAQFDSDRNVGLLPLGADFWSLKKIIGYDWKFGDGYGQQGPKNIHHEYFSTVSAVDDSSFDVSLNDLMAERFITPYAPSERAYSYLKFVCGSPCHGDENWSNAVDGDIYWTSGTASVTADATGKPWAIFEFNDQQIKKICKLRMMTDTGYLNGSQQVRHFRVLVSTTGLDDADFALLLDAEKSPIVETPCQFNDDWAQWNVALTDARYIKLVVDAPECYWRQLGEFEVYHQTTLADGVKSYLETAGHPVPDGLDSAIVTLRIWDGAANPLTGLSSDAVRFAAVNKHTLECNTGNDWFGRMRETAPGVYETCIKSRVAGTKLLRAYIEGVLVDHCQDGTACEVEFGAEQTTEASGKISGLPGNKLVFVKGSATAKNEGWDNAVDGDLEGWDGTVTARGADEPAGPAWGIFRFAGDQAYRFDRFNLQIDNGSDDDAFANRQTTVLEVLVSTTDIQPASFASVGEFIRLQPGWTTYRLPQMISARYIQLVLKQPIWQTGAWRQIVEFEVQTAAKNGAELASEAAGIVALPTSYALDQNYPNPFNVDTMIKYQLPEDAMVKIEIMDITGRIVTTLVNERESAGFRSIRWNARSVGSGVYFCRMTAGHFTDTKRLILIK